MPELSGRHCQQDSFLNLRCSRRGQRHGLPGRLGLNLLELCQKLLPYVLLSFGPVKHAHTHTPCIVHAWSTTYHRNFCQEHQGTHRPRLSRMRSQQSWQGLSAWHQHWARRPKITSEFQQFTYITIIYHNPQQFTRLSSNCW